MKNEIGESLNFHRELKFDLCRWTVIECDVSFSASSKSLRITLGNSHIFFPLSLLSTNLLLIYFSLFIFSFQWSQQQQNQQNSFGCVLRSEKLELIVSRRLISPGNQLTVNQLKINFFLFNLNRVLYGNKITDLPPGIFHGLTSLQLLLLNANEISCIRKDSFKDLHSVNLL